ncbi:MAG: MerR family transcriptional regulator [Candidatus Omnitrophota bacterium]
MGQVYLLKDLAVITGHSVDTIKYYLKIGLIKETGKTPETNFRYFDDRAVEILKKIRSLRIEGTPIAQIRQELKKSA